MLDRQVGNAAPRIDPVRADEGLGRAGVEAARAAIRNAGPLRPARRARSSRLVRITPRNSQLPCSRLTRLVCLPCQPIPAACASGFSITGAVSTNTLSSDGACVDDEPRQRLQRLLDRLVIVAALGVDRDPPELRMRRQCQRIARRRIAHAQRDRGFRFGPQRQRRHAMVRALLHPAHRPVVPGLQPALEVEPGRVGRVGARKAARRETQPLRFRSYCFLKALAGIHPAPIPVHPELVEGPPLNLQGKTVLRQASARTERSRGRSARSRQGLRRHARRRRRQPRRPGRHHLRTARPQRRGQDDDVAHAARDHRSVERQPARARPRAPARGAPARSAICPRSAAFIRRCMRARRLPSWARCAGCRWPKAAAAPTPCWLSTILATGPKSRSAHCPRAWRRSSSCSAPSSTSRG